MFMAQTKNRFKIFSVLGAILFVALIIRLNHLTERSLWFDEAFSWRLIQFPFNEFITRAAADVHPVLYYVVLRIWSLIGLFFNDGTSLFWLRLLSVLFSVGTVWSMYYCGKKLYKSRWIGIAAALITMVNAFQVQYSWEARMYSLGTFLVPISLALVILSTEKTKRIYWPIIIGTGLVVGAILHVHYYTLFSVAALVVFCAAYMAYSFTKNRKTIKKASLNMVAGLVLGLVLFLPWLPVFMHQRQQVQQSYWIPPMDSWSIPSTMSRLLLGGTDYFPHRTAVIASIIVVAVLALPLLIGRRKGDLLLVASFVLPFAGSWYLSKSTSIYQERYFVFASLALILLFARSVYFFPRRLANLLIILIVCFGFYRTSMFWKQLDFRNHHGAAAAAEFVLNEARPEQPILVSSSFIYFPVAFHLPSGVRYGLAKNQEDVAISTPHLYTESGELSHFGGGPILTKDDIVGKEIFATKPKTVWVFDTTGFGGSKLVLPDNYKLIDSRKFSELFAHQGEIIVNKYQLE